jgi:Putative zinc-finger
MRQETNNEIDLLLRRLSRHDTSMPDAGGDHLDADELSAYAENALPTAARARYTEHLAECSGCRELVVKLSSSAGVVVAEETSRTPAGLGVRGFLASLFSSMVLRYSIPALGLILVAVIGIGLWRQQRPGEEVAQQTQVMKDQTSPPPTEAPTVGTASGVVAPRPEGAESSATPAERPTKVGQADSPAPNQPITVTTDASKEDASAKKAEEQPTANAVAGLPAPKPSVTVDEFRRSEVEVQKQARLTPAAPVEVAREKANEPAKDEDRRADEVARGRSAQVKARNEPAGSKSGVQTGSATARLQADGIESRENDDAETRSVAGRRFRKERGIWIDTAYESSRSAMTLTRGSERFRALVADEPSIKTIADELDGEVIVVWKGRAYRIR